MDEMVKKYGSKLPPAIATESKPAPEITPEESKEAEEARLLKAIKSRGKPATATQPKKPEPTPTVSSAASSTAQVVRTESKQAWKDKRDVMDTERKSKAAELEVKKKQEQAEKRQQEERSKKEKDDITKSLSTRGGVPTTFCCDGLMEFDAEVFICGSVTGGKEVQVPLDTNAMEFKITMSVPPGTHFYRFKVDGRWVVDKKKPTGVDPLNSELANKVEL